MHSWGWVLCPSALPLLSSPRPPVATSCRHQGLQAIVAAAAAAAVGAAPGLSQGTQLSPQTLKELSTSEVTAEPCHCWPRTDHGQERGSWGYGHRRPTDSESGLTRC